MIETIAAIARWLQLAANMTLLGSCVFLILAGSIKKPLKHIWVERAEQSFLWLVLTIIAGLLIILATTAGQATGNITDLWHPEVWYSVITDTRMGNIWVGRFALVLLLLGVVIYLRNTSRERWHYLLCGIFSILPLIAGSLVSHTAAEDLSVLAVLPYALHIIFGGIWLGALPILLLMLVSYVKHENNQKTNTADAQTLKLFSSLAMPIMLLIIATGVIVADRTFDDHYAALVATPYGWLLSAKLVLLIFILIIAARVRSNWLPVFLQAKNTGDTFSSANSMRKLIRVEYIFALLLLLVATILSNTTPAKHATIENWLFPFRFSIDATWNQDIAIQVWIGITIFIVAIATFLVGMTRRWNIQRQIGFPSILFIVSFAVALPPLSIEAYPETYRGTPIPFDAASIANGADLYQQNCVTCHGPQGKGNGILSRTLSTVPIDLLTEPHTEEHTAGDFYHWLTYGVKDTEMPGYEDELSEEDRWDLVNFIHALARGYQARIMSPKVVANRPYMVPPDFFYAAQDGTSGLLQDFHEEMSVLVVLFSWPESQARLEQLAQAHSQLNDQNTLIIAVPIEDPSAETISNMAPELPFPVVTQGASEIVSSYALSRRTLSHPDMMGNGATPDHMEFLIDRYGYLRARWIPSADKTGWDNIDLLTNQLNQIKQEKQVLPIASDFVN